MGIVATDKPILDSFDATYLYDYSFILLYNLIFTSLPVIVLGGEWPDGLGGNISSQRPTYQHSTRILTQKRRWHSQSSTFEAFAV